MIQRETFTYGLLAHRRDNLYGLSMTTSAPRDEYAYCGLDRTLVAIYDWKIDSYQPNDSLSTI